MTSGTHTRIAERRSRPTIQSDIDSVTLNASGRATVTFPVAFDVTPVVVVTSRRNTATTMTAHVVTVSSTSFTYQVDSDGVALASTAHDLHWIAIA
jgi:hypothetical protein